MSSGGNDKRSSGGGGNVNVVRYGELDGKKNIPCLIFFFLERESAPHRCVMLLISMVLCIVNDGENEGEGVRDSFFFFVSQERGRISFPFLTKHLCFSHTSHTTRKLSNRSK